jgi:hypothetical protein
MDPRATPQSEALPRPSISRQRRVGIVKNIGAGPMMLQTKPKPLTQTQILRKQLEVEKARNDERDEQYIRLEERVEEHIRSETTMHEEGERRNKKLFWLFSKSGSSSKGGKKK